MHLQENRTLEVQHEGMCIEPAASVIGELAVCVPISNGCMRAGLQ